MSQYYEKYEVPGGAFGIPTTIHLHHDGERRQSWQALLERARRRPRWHIRDNEPQLPERFSHEEIRRDARRRDQFSARAPAQRASFRGSDGGWRERWTRDEHAAALRQFSDALKRHYRDQGLDETEGDEPLRAFLDWIAAHMDPSDIASGQGGKPRRNPNQLDVESVLKYVWPDPKRYAAGFGLKTSAGSNGSERMTAGSAGFRDSAPRTVADLNALHRRHYRGKIL